MNNPMVQVYKIVYFPKQDYWHADDVGVRSRVIQKQN